MPPASLALVVVFFFIPTACAVG